MQFWIRVNTEIILLATQVPQGSLPQVVTRIPAEESFSDF